MRRPVNAPYTITTEFGVPDSYAKFGRHSGVDYAVPAGRPIYAPVSGVLTNVVSPTGGNMVVIFDGQFYHRLMHNSSFSRGNGAVGEGDEVAKAGTTGLSTGVHSHWDINREGTYPTSFNSFVSPADWLAGKYVQQQPQGEAPMNDGDITNLYKTLLGRDPDPGGLSTFRGKPWKEGFYGIIGSAEYATRQAQRNQQIADLQTALANEQNKPPKEVIKEVEKIVEVIKEVPVEVIKEVPVPVDEKQVVQNVFLRFWNSLFKKG